MDGKVFSKETKDLIVKVGDDMVHLPWYAEPFDGPAIRIIVNFIDTKADQFVPDEIDPLINDAILLAFEGNYDAASEKAGTALNKLIDVPLLDENSEQLMFVEGVKFLIALVKDWIEKKKQP